MSERRLEADGVLGVPPPVAGNGPAVIIDEGEQVGLAAADLRSVEGVTRPPVVGRGRFEPAERLRRGPVGTSVQPETREQPLDRPDRHHGCFGRGHDLGNLSGGPGRYFSLQLHGQVQHRSRCPRLRRPRIGDERFEAAGPPLPDPLVQGRAANLQALPVRPGVIASGHGADQHAAVGLRQGRIGRLPDQRIAEQADVTTTV